MQLAQYLSAACKVRRWFGRSACSICAGGVDLTVSANFQAYKGFRAVLYGLYKRTTPSEGSGTALTVPTRKVMCYPAHSCYLAVSFRKGTLSCCSVGKCHLGFQGWSRLLYTLPSRLIILASWVRIAAATRCTRRHTCKVISVLLQV